MVFQKSFFIQRHLRISMMILFFRYRLKACSPHSMFFYRNHLIIVCLIKFCRTGTSNRLIDATLLIAVFRDVILLWLWRNGLFLLQYETRHRFWTRSIQVREDLFRVKSLVNFIVIDVSTVLYGAEAGWFISSVGLNKRFLLVKHKEFAAFQLAWWV